MFGFMTGNLIYRNRWIWIDDKSMPGKNNVDLPADSIKQGKGECTGWSLLNANYAKGNLNRSS